MCVPCVLYAQSLCGIHNYPIQTDVGDPLWLDANYDRWAGPRRPHDIGFSPPKAQGRKPNCALTTTRKSIGMLLAILPFVCLQNVIFLVASPKGSSVCLLLLPNIVKVTFVTPFVMVYDDDVVLAWFVKAWVMSGLISWLHHWVAVVEVKAKDCS